MRCRADKTHKKLWATQNEQAADAAAFQRDEALGCVLGSVNLRVGKAMNLWTDVKEWNGEFAAAWRVPVTWWLLSQSFGWFLPRRLLQLMQILIEIWGLISRWDANSLIDTWHGHITGICGAFHAFISLKEVEEARLSATGFQVRQNGWQRYLFIIRINECVVFWSVVEKTTIQSVWILTG